MTTTGNLAPLLDLPPAQLGLRDGVLSHRAGPAAIGVLAGDVVDLLPGESRAVDFDGVPEGWNVRG